jgi:hypothetical protein
MYKPGVIVCIIVILLVSTAGCSSHTSSPKTAVQPGVSGDNQVETPTLPDQYVASPVGTPTTVPASTVTPTLTENFSLPEPAQVTTINTSNSLGGGSACGPYSADNPCTIVSTTQVVLAGSYSQTGNLTVTSEPAGAEISLDGVMEPASIVTNTSFTNVDAGSHNVSVSLAGYNPSPAYQIVTVNAGSSMSANFTLEEQMGNISVYSEPAGAEISIDGESENAVTNTTIPDVVPGSHTITVSLTDYIPSPAYQIVTVTGGSTVDANFTFTNSSG